jgi:HNH endonuclease
MKIDQIWSQVARGSQQECWPWRRARDRTGYGRVTTCGRSRAAHRVIYELRHGAVPTHLCICHACDNPACCNPDHLWVGTRRDNTLDMVRKGRSGRQNGSSGPRGEHVHTAKLTEDQVRDIRLSPEKARTLAKRYAVNRKQIYVIRSGKAWAHI